MKTSLYQLEVFRRDLSRELAALFRIEPDHSGIERILEEAQAHIEDAIAASIDEGAGVEEATAAALVRFGTASQVARAYAAARAPSFIDPEGDVAGWRRVLRKVQRGGRKMTLSQWSSDVRLALRFLRKSPGYALAFVLTLGLGIGANTAIFSVVHGVWLQPLPYRDGERLVYLRHSADLAGINNVFFSVPEIDDYRRQCPSLEGVTEFSAMTFTILGLEEPTQIRAGVVTGNYFEVMGLGARVGRVIGSSDDGEGVAPVAVLTHEYWQRQFGGDPGVVGRAVTMNGRSVEIVGVAEPAPPYPERTDIYVNMVSSPHHLSASMVHDRVHRMTEVFARLAPGTSRDSARVEVEAVTRRLHEEYPQAYDSAHGYGVALVDLRSQLAAQARSTIFMLLAVAAFVLLTALANVANLTLTRAMRRRDEWALRVSLGAKTGTLRRQLLAENIVPSLIGGLLGVIFAVAGVDLLAAYIARYSARASEISVDVYVLGAALFLALAAACLFAFLPRLPGRFSHNLGALRSGRASASLAGRRMQRLLVVVQVGVSFVLLVGAGLLLETLWNLQRDEGGVELEEVLTMRIPVAYGSRSPDQRRSYYSAVLERVSAVPGVRSAALGSMVPLKEAPRGLLAGLAALEFEIEGRPTEPGAPPPRADFRIVSGDYFDTLGLTLLKGRTFEITDTPDAAKVIVINQALAEHYFPGREAVGQRIGWRGETLHFLGVDKDYRTIVGVVSDAKDYGVAEDVPHVAFNPFSQVPLGGSLFVRSAQPGAVARPIMGEIHKLDPQQPIIDVATLEQIRTQSISPHRLNAALVGAFAVLALSVAAVGVAGVLAFSVSQRTREFGIRAALGADRSLLMATVLKEGGFLALLGLAVGLAASLAFAEFISGLLHDVAATDAGTLGGVALLLAAVALLASALPAWRAAETDPVKALREE